MINIENITADIQDIHTALSALAYALGRQDSIDADKLRSDMLEICLALNPPVATELVTEIARSVLSGRDHRGL